MKFIWRISLLTAFTVLFLSGCTTKSGTDQEIQASPTTAATATAILVPKEGKAILIGSAFSTVTGTALDNVAIRLADVYRQEGQEGAFVLDLAHSPGNFTDASGAFIIENIKPGEYLIVVGNPEDNNYMIVQDGDGKPISYNLAVGEVKDTGKLNVDFKP
jgi:uncharacterized lipoprotein